MFFICCLTFFICCLTAVAQTAVTTPLSPAQQRAQARAAQQAAAKQAAETRQAAAKQAAENRQAAAKQAAETRQAAAKQAAGSKQAAGQATKGKTANMAGSSAAPMANTTQKTPVAAASPMSVTGTSGTVGSGTLNWGNRVYTSSGCIHNGNSAVCTFTFVNQGNAATLTAGGAGELSGIQLVDDAHVPHKWTQAHFLDKYGTQQPRLILQPGDAGTYVVTFGDVNSQVSSAEFHLRTQIVGGITFGGVQSAAANHSPTAVSAAATPK